MYKRLHAAGLIIVTDSNFLIGKCVLPTLRFPWPITIKRKLSVVWFFNISSLQCRAVAFYTSLLLNSTMLKLTWGAGEENHEWWNVKTGMKKWHDPAIAILFLALKLLWCYFLMLLFKHTYAALIKILLHLQNSIGIKWKRKKLWF